MASLIKQKGSYYAQFYDCNQHPKRKQVALKTRTRRVAERLLSRLEDQYALDEFDPWSQEDTADMVELGSAVAAFLDTRSNLSPHSIRKYKTVLGLLERYLDASYQVHAIGPRELQQFLYSEKREAITRGVYRKTMSTFFTWLVDKGAISVNPAKKVRLDKVPQKFPRFLTPQEVDAICQCIKKEVNENPKVTAGTCLWLVPVIRANVFLGLRVSEVVNLTWEDVDLDRRQLTVRQRKGFTTKSGKERVLPLCESVVDILTALERRSRYVFPNYGGTKLHPQYLSRRFKRFVRKAKLPENINFHTTRHTALSWLAQQGASVEAIRLYAGHSSIVVTQKYMHLSPNAYMSQITDAFKGIE